MEGDFIVKPIKQRRVLADGTVREYITNKKVPARKKDFKTAKSISDKVKQAIRADLALQIKKKAICEKYGISYHVLRELLV